VSSDDITNLFKNLIANYTLGELKLMVEGENKNNLPVIAVLGISALLHDMKTGTLTATNSVLDRVMGKPKQDVSISGSAHITISQSLSEAMEEEERRED
jgi:nitrogenase molybdenum-iron protein alpha/beta subunit